MQTPRDCSNTEQLAFNARIFKCLLWLSNMERKLELVHFLSSFHFFLNGLWISCLKKHLSSNSKWFLYHVVFWNVNAKSDGLSAKKSRMTHFYSVESLLYLKSFQYSYLTSITNEEEWQFSGSTCCFLAVWPWESCWNSLSHFLVWNIERIIPRSLGYCED